ncbi:MAG: hypothetical protein ACI4KM_01215 [Oscillospiraceae bacterium]
MRIVKCAHCNRLVHSDNVCFFCGNETGGETVCEAEVHENARESFAAADALVAQGSFAEAETELCEVMKWSPNSPEVHWLRLLARAKCKNDRELFFSGISIAETPDYETAQRYAGETEKQVYTAVEAAASALKKAVVEAVTKRNAALIDKLGLPAVLSETKRIIGEKRSRLLSLWQELRKCEQELKLLELEGQYYIYECRNNMHSARDESARIRSDLENTAEMGRKEYFTYKVKLESLKKTAEAAKEEFYRLKSQHPSVAAAAELIKKRDSLKSAIDSELAEVKRYEQRIQAVISDMNAVRREGNVLLETAQAGGYEQVKSVIGQSNFDCAVKHALSI